MNKNLENIKKEYLEIEASENLKNKVNKILENNKSNTQKKYINIFKNVIAACLIIFFTFFSILNINPTFAKTISEIPGFYNIVRILTFNKYSFKDSGIEANIITPQIQGLSNKELETKLNEEFKEISNELIKAFEKDAQKLREEFPEEEIHMGIESNYQVKTNNENFLSIDIYILNTVGSSSTVHNFYTINKKTGKLIELKDLFKENCEYVKIISEYIKEEIKTQNENNEYPLYFYDFEDETQLLFKEINPEQKFYINNNNELVICFDKYEIAPGSTGSPEFIIPNDILKEILK